MLPVPPVCFFINHFVRRTIGPIQGRDDGSDSEAFMDLLRVAISFRGLRCFVAGGEERGSGEAQAPLGRAARAFGMFGAAIDRILAWRPRFARSRPPGVGWWLMGVVSVFIPWWDSSL